MKKNNQKSFIPSVNVSLRHILSLPTIICLLIFAILLFHFTYFESIYDDAGGYYYTLIDCIQSEVNSIDPYYHFRLSYSDPLLPALCGMLLGMLQFSFLLNKKACLTHLSFAVKRGRFYLYRTLFPLLCAVWIISVLEISVVFFNTIYIGFHINLIKALFARLLLNILPLIFCFTVTVASHIFTSRKIEAITLQFSLIMLPTAIKKLVGTLFTATLFGHGDSIYSCSSEIDDFFAKLDPIGYSIALEDSFNYISAKENITILPMVIGYIAIIILCIVALTLFGLYFSKRFKPEASGIKGKSKIALTIMSVSLPVMISASVLEILFYDLNDGNVYDQSTTSLLFRVIVAVIIGAIACVIINLIVSLGIKNFICGLYGAAIIALLHLFIIITGFTGCFGFSSYIPEANDILYIDISLPFNDFCTNQENCFYKNNTPNYLFVYNRSDFEIIRKIHKSVIDTKGKKETAVDCAVTYTLKSGKTVTRHFYNISEEAAYEYLNLWETDTVNYSYKYLLGQNTAEDTEKQRKYIETAFTTDYYESLFDGVSSFQSVYDYYYSGYYNIGTQVSFTDDIYIISKDNRVTDIGKTADKDTSRPPLAENIELITEALYKDICSLSAEEWFMPEKQLGILVFAPYYNDDFEYSAENIIVNNNDVFYINSNMTNTLKVLDKLGYSKHFECTKKIENAHLVDVNHMAHWMEGYLYHEMSLPYEEQYAQPVLHSTYFTQNNQEIYEYLDSGCNYYGDSTDYEIGQFESETIYFEPPLFGGFFANDYYEDSGSYSEPLPPPKTDITDKAVAEDMLNNAYMSYNVGNNGDFLIIKYTDGSCNALIIPS